MWVAELINGSDELAKAISDGAFHADYVADLIVDGQVKLQDVSLPQCELQSDGAQKILTQGTASFVYSDDIGTSILPKDLTSWLTPFASFLDVSYRVAVGDSFMEKVLRGRLKITGVSDPQGRMIRFQDRLLTVGSSVSLKLADMFYVTDGERFIAPSAPSDLSSVWAEIGRLTGFGMKRTVADGSITRSVTYQENRLDAVFDLAKIIGGMPYMTPDGSLSMASSVWGEPVLDLRMGAGGTIVRADPDDLSDADVYNQVVVRSWDDQQATVLATAEITSGPLRYGGPMGRKPFFVSSQYVTTNEQAQAFADAQLPIVSRMPAVTYTIQCAPDPRLEVWDVITFQTAEGAVLPGRIQKITLPGTGTMTLVVEVDRG